MGEITETTKVREARGRKRDGSHFKRYKEKNNVASRTRQSLDIGQRERPDTARDRRARRRRRKQQQQRGGTPIPFEWQNHLPPAAEPQQDVGAEPGELCVLVFGNGQLCAEEGHWDSRVGEAV